MTDPYAELRERLRDRLAATERDDPDATSFWNEEGTLFSRNELLEVAQLLAERDALAGSTVTRFEVIDHRLHTDERGRVFVSWDCHIEPSVQDDGRTLKVFVGDKP